MTDHTNMPIRRAEQRVRDPELIKAMLDLCPVCTLALHDEPYPYEVPLNYGYCWDDKLVIYMHMGKIGHKMDLLQKNPHVACSMYTYLSRVHTGKYRNEMQDYRSVTVFGKAEIITCEQEDEYLRGLNALQIHADRKPLTKAPKHENLVVLKVTADVVTAKSMYPITELSEVEMPL